jgi:hypothetical protein
MLKSLWARLVFIDTPAHASISSLDSCIHADANFSSASDHPL